MSGFESIAALVKSLTEDDVKNYHASAQQPLRPIDTQFWLLFPARTPSPTSNQNAYVAHRYKVIGYDMFATYEHSYEWWAVGERIGVHFEDDGASPSRRFPVTTWRVDDRGAYSDYPPEWEGLLKENAGSFGNAIPPSAVFQAIADSPAARQALQGPTP